MGGVIGRGQTSCTVCLLPELDSTPPAALQLGAVRRQEATHQAALQQHREQLERLGAHLPRFLEQAEQVRWSIFALLPVLHSRRPAAMHGWLGHCWSCWAPILRSKRYARGATWLL